MVEQPFQDLLIADISGTVATCYAGKLFADYGARVVNVEPLSGFSTRNLEPLLGNGESALYGYLNAGKESVTTEDAAGHEAVAGADLVLLDPGQVTFDEIRTNVCAISWFGLDGPYAEYQGSDAVIQALTGLMKGIGEAEGPPLIPSGYQAQMLGGLSAFNGALAQLMGPSAQKTDGEHRSSFVLDASIFEANLCLTELAPINAFNGNPVAFRMGINKFPPTYPLGIWPCRDGWLGVTCLSPSQWHSFCELLELDDLIDVPLFQSSAARLEAADLIEPRILEALRQRSAEELFYRGQAMRIPLARVPTMAELFSVDQYVQRQAFGVYRSGDEAFAGPAIPFRLLESPPKLGGELAALGADNESWLGSVGSYPVRRWPPETGSQPLAGLKVVDLGMGWAGPLAARNLADLGATVIKVESCTRFDWWRSWEATEEWIESDGAEKSLQFVYVNRNKLNVTLDLESQRGRELLLELVAQADALLENFSGEVMAKLRLDYEHLKAVNPGLVMLSMPPFGGVGPWSGFRAYGSTVEQSSGLPHLNGTESHPPTMLHVAYGDAISGLNGTAALLTALYHKRRTGQGQLVDISQVECLFPLAAPGILHQAVHGVAPPRPGNRHPERVPHGVYPCEGDDNWLLIQVNSDDEWTKLCRLVLPLAPYQSLDAEERQHQCELIESILIEWLSVQDARELMHRLQAEGLVAAVLSDMPGVMQDMHLQARGYWQMLERDFVGVQPHPSPPWRLSAEPISVKTPAPTLGQHNSLVLGEMLGVSESQLEELTSAGVIGTRPRLS